MEWQKQYQKDKYRHVNFLETLPIKEEKILKLFLKRNQNPIDLAHQMSHPYDENHI